MKNLFLLLFITIFLNGCERDYIRNNTLPPLTNTGENTAGCLVNGEVFVPKSPLFSERLYRKYKDDFFVLTIYQKRTNETKSLNIRCKIPFSQEGIIGVYPLNAEDNLDLESGAGYYHAYNSSSLNDIYYSTTSDFVGELIITYYNHEKFIISGTFWFDAINSEGEVMEVSDGRFDVKFY